MMVYLDLDLEMTQKFFSQKVLRPWHRLPTDAMGSLGRMTRWEVFQPIEGIGTGLALRSLPTQTMLGFYNNCVLSGKKARRDQSSPTLQVY